MTRIIKSQKRLKSKEGFTLIEVMLVLGITGLILLGLLGGTFSTIARERYNDSLRGFAEFLSLAYSEVLSPETLGAGNDSRQVILGKMLVFGYSYGNERKDRSVYSATIVGNAKPNKTDTPDFLSDFVSDDTEASIICGKEESGTVTVASTVSSYIPLWEARLYPASDSFKMDKPFTGTIIIARTPNSSSVQTIFSNHTYNLDERCTPTNGGANGDFRKDLQEQAKTGGAKIFEADKEIGICVKSEDSAIIREVRIAAGGRNTSAISMMPEGESKCH